MRFKEDVIYDRINRNPPFGKRSSDLSGGVGNDFPPSSEGFDPDAELDKMWEKMAK